MFCVLFLVKSAVCSNIVLNLLTNYMFSLKKPNIPVKKESKSDNILLYHGDILLCKSVICPVFESKECSCFGDIR